MFLSDCNQGVGFGRPYLLKLKHVHRMALNEFEPELVHSVTIFSMQTKKLFFSALKVHSCLCIGCFVEHCSTNFKGTLGMSSEPIIFSI